ncbi:PAS domain S-box-containing protein [Halogranum amylolyticum]|uniref:PAS domain S-box-containing protein n=1 Tax=Halogranum amylolyticum TaxID=660520 RepID=A0A1H8UP19_9EURY|nr:bacterio-opsin activator domain-containing protein [Halogranum amylolyticum]SEP04949.1 PAS domain S-box-containing protein [Halogranum amylolyticum]
MVARPSTPQRVHVLLVGTADWVGPLRTALDVDADYRVSTVETAAEAETALDGQLVDTLVTAADLPDGSGLDVLERVRAGTSSLPVVLCSTSGSERLASDAVAAGVSEYLPLAAGTDHDGNVAAIREALERTLDSGHTTTTERARARQFDAIFDDGRTATWVLDADGVVTRANETASELHGERSEALVDRPFWSLPWWGDDEQTAADVRHLVDAAREGSFGNAVVTTPEAAKTETQTLELSVRPVLDDHGRCVSLVVEGVDVTDRVSLERELRRSEELHRVTLNNMTDTVLMTDEDGEYTYVCPNVNFIFGYTAEEIHELGTIDELLGEDLFDREELADEGVLKNIECTATDKAGREHTLLVNVREVSIQDGTLLYSCRDITKRKQREEALTTLQETTRDFLYAQTRHEIAQHVVDDVPSVLTLDASAVYLFDADATDLVPVAHSSAMEQLDGPLSTVPTDAEGLISYSFVEGESLFFDDVHDSTRLQNPATDLRSVAYIPLGDHGVFVVGTAERGRFDEVTRELADLLAATAEAALDRVRRESQLREQDRELQQRNNQLTELNRINEIIREIDQALVQAETREEIEHAVCSRLTDDDRFAFAWIGAADSPGETLRPRAWAGAEQGYLDSVSFPITADGVEPAGRTAATREVTMVQHVADGLREEPWRKDALAREYLSVLSVPLAYDEFTYGVLTVYAARQDAFDEMSRAVMAELGETIASATSAIERKNALLTPSMTRLEVDVDDSTFVLARLARQADCRLTYEGGIQQTPDGASVFVTVEGATIEAVERAADELVAVGDVQRISADESGGVLRLRLTQPFFALELADHGAVLRSVTVDGSTSESSARLVVDVPNSVDSRHITDLLGETFAEMELRSKQTVEHASTDELSSAFLGRLTERQLEVVQIAHYSGFFESPRATSGETLAEALDISPTAFYRHVRTAQRKLFSTVFDEGGVPVPAVDGP